MLTTEQTIKIENYKAQHNSLLSNISDTNKKLEDLLRGVSTTERELKVVNKELFVKHKNLVETLRSLKEFENNIDVKEKLQLKFFREQKIQAEKATQDLLKTEHLFNKTTDKYQENLKKINKQIDSAETSLILAKLTTEEKQRKLKEVNKTIQLKTNESRELDSSLLELKHDIDDREKLFDKNLKEQTKILKDITDKVKEEVEKLKLPNKLLDEREKELTKKETNYQIKNLRWKKLFTRMFPNQEFKY